MTHDYIDRDAIPYVAANDGTVYVAFKEYVDKIPAADVYQRVNMPDLKDNLLSPKWRICIYAKTMAT